MNDHQPPAARSGASADRIVRHALTDRLLHWLIAASVIVLLATAFLPVLGIDFDWVDIHWITGWCLIALVVVHTVRALFWQDLWSVWFDRADLADAWAIVRATFRRGEAVETRSGKYSFAQKFIHFAFTCVVLAALVTGGFMMVKVDTPWWDRNPYWLSDPTWGVVYVVHGLAAMVLITMIMAHVYFALRPEKWLFLRSMIRGWISRSEYLKHHDPNRWRVDQ